MRLKGIFSRVCTLTLVGALAACQTQPSDDEQESLQVETEVESSGLQKDSGGANGDSDFCRGTVPCDPGEGDCDSNAECAGSTCGRNNGPAFGMPFTFDVCVVTHCLNGTQDVDEDDVDCGGADCGVCGSRLCATGRPPVGDNNYCNSTCPCNAQEGDCDSDAECATGTVCVNDVGARFGVDPSQDYCLAAHCEDGVQADGETGVDCGGDCGPCTCPGTEGTAGFCTPSCPCDFGEGLCATDADCSSGLVCKRLGNVKRCDLPISSVLPSTSVRAFSGGDTTDGLDMIGFFPYAVNMRGPAGAVVGNATFTADSAAGVTFTAQNELLNWFTPNFGASANDNGLESVMQSIRWSNAGTPVAVNLANLVLNRKYKLQLLFQEGCCDRGFDVFVEGNLIADNFSPAAVQGGTTNTTQGAVIIHEFVARDATLNIVLQGVAPNPDNNPILNALTLEKQN